jgi:methyltransferase (TIGR00027 family)
MKKRQSSLMAEGIAIARVLEGEKPENERICNDPYARKLISPIFYWIGKIFADAEERKGPGVLGFLVARCRYMDDALQQALKSGLQQLVILGAGLDSRAYRFEELKEGVKVFEVDHPASQAAKLKKVKRIFEELPGYVHYVPIDFNEETLDKIFEHGYMRTLKTLFIWEGVSMYLKPAAVDQTLTWISGNAGKGSELVFDYLYSSALKPGNQPYEVRKSMRAGRLTGEGLSFGIEQGELEEFLIRRGFGNIREITAGDLRRLYFHGANQNRAVAEYYAIAHAKINKSKNPD